MSKTFLLLGDSNVRRWIPKLCVPHKMCTEYVPVHNSSELRPALDKIASPFQTVIFAGITNILIADASECTHNINRLEAINTSISGVLSSLSEAISKVPEMNLYVVLPTPRTKPQWFMPLMAEICKLVLSNVKSFVAPIKVMRAPLLSMSDLDSDGVHLNSISGLPYVQGLIDDARALNEIGDGDDSSTAYEYTSNAVVELSAVVASHQVQIRQLTDKLTVTTCQHAEEACGRQNVDCLNRFIIIGAPYLEQSDQLQSRLKSQVAYYLRAMGPGMPTDIAYVRQFRSKRGAVYDVEMRSVASSSRVRATYGSYFRKGGNPPPPPLSRISITNSLTFATRVRVRLMKEVAKKHKLVNSDLNVFVTSYEPRPVLKIKDKKGPVSTFTFCEAMQRFSHHLSQDFLVNIARFAHVQIARDDLTPIFLVLSPDMLKGPIPLSLTPDKAPAQPSQATPIQSTSSGASNSVTAATPSGSSIRKRKTNPAAKGASVGGAISKRGKAPMRGRGVLSRRGNVRKQMSQEPMETESIGSQDDEETADESIIPIDFSAAVEQQAFVSSED